MIPAELDIIQGKLEDLNAFTMGLHPMIVMTLAEGKTAVTVRHYRTPSHQHRIQH